MSEAKRVVVVDLDALFDEAKRDERNRRLFEMRDPFWGTYDPVDRGYLIGIQRCETGSRCGCTPCICHYLDAVAARPATEREKLWMELQ